MQFEKLNDQEFGGELRKRLREVCLMLKHIEYGDVGVAWNSFEECFVELSRDCVWVKKLSIESSRRESEWFNREAETTITVLRT